MGSIVSLPNNMFTGQAKSSKLLTSVVHILSPETDNCSSSISGRERITIENILWSISTKECCQPGRGRTRNLITSQMRIELSHQGPLSSAEFAKIVVKVKEAWSRKTVISQHTRLVICKQQKQAKKPLTRLQKYQIDLGLSCHLHMDIHLNHSTPAWCF